jgi:hypothetical protein
MSKHCGIGIEEDFRRAHCSSRQSKHNAHLRCSNKLCKGVWTHCRQNFLYLHFVPLSTSLTSSHFVPNPRSLGLSGRRLRMNSLLLTPQVEHTILIRGYLFTEFALLHVSIFNHNFVRRRASPFPVARLSPTRSKTSRPQRLKFPQPSLKVNMIFIVVPFILDLSQYLDKRRRLPTL